MNDCLMSAKWWIVLPFISVISFGIYVFLLALNVPYTDDIALIDTLNGIHNPDISFFTTIWTQQNDHRIVFSRLATWCIYLFNGNMNFRIMIILGFGNLIALAYAFYLIFKSANNRLAYFAPIPILLFSPIVQATHLWALTAFEHSLAICFSLFSLYFLQPSRQKVWLFALPLGVAATISNLDGLCVLPVGLVWLILQKRGRDSVIYALFISVYLYLFFLNFTFSPATVMVPFPDVIGVIFKGFLSFTGGIVKVITDTHAYSLSIVAGVTFIAIFMVFVLRKMSLGKGSPTMFLPINYTDISFLSLLASAFMIATGRAGDEAGSMVAIRFQVYAVTILILFYLVCINNLSQKKYKSLVFVGFLCVAVLFNILSYFKYHQSVVEHQNALKADASNFRHHAILVHQFPNNSPDPEIFRHYNFPEFFEKSVVANWKKQMDQQDLDSKILVRTEDVTGKSEFSESGFKVANLEISNLPKNMPIQNVYLVLFNDNISKKNPYMFALKANSSGMLNKIRFDKTSPRTYSVKLVGKIPDVAYQVALCWEADNKAQSVLVAKDFRIGEPVNEVEEINENVLE